jgi:rubrerythrin
MMKNKTKENFKYYHICNRCNWPWLSRKEHPKRCPNRKCTNPYYWDIPRDEDFIKGDDLNG